MQSTTPDRSRHGLDVEKVPSSVESKTAGAIEWSTEQLFGAAQEIGIRHEGLLYRLRRTRLGKLILTK
jgi:hemin uptake protein HemP